MKHVLLVDDDLPLQRMVCAYLDSQDFRVSAVSDGPAMERVIAEEIVDLVILDMKLADEDGLLLLRDLRARSTVPVIILTGARRDETDRIVGLEMGADDYVTKPFSQRELLARIRAVLRRHEIAKAASADARNEKFRFAGWEVNLRQRRLTAPDGGPVSLTKGEFNLLVAFLRSPQRVLSREYLLSASRLHEDEVFDRSIDVQILRLRRKLEANPSEPRFIRTERGVGYILAVPVETF